MPVSDDTDSHDFDRFVQAQDPVYADVLAELGRGRKSSHWMWFIFPQLAGLGQSSLSRRFAIADLAEAQAYLAHPVLGARLRECTDLVNRVEGRDIHAIFGSPDDLKFHSSMTLFHRAAPGETIFHTALQRYFGGGLDARTLSLL
ncbi:MAG: DUF1810 domain-containing protein [Rhodospirillaceae bacterium]|nr:DUF1810 domain-containing protein [Rhodospirillaceae bacterium]